MWWQRGPCWGRLRRPVLRWRRYRRLGWKAYLSIGIKSPASVFWHPPSQSGTRLDSLTPVPDSVWHWHFIHSSTGLTGCRTVRHSGHLKAWWRKIHPPRLYCTVPEFIDPVFTKTSPKRSFSVTQNERFGLVFAKTGSIILGTVGGREEYTLHICFAYGEQRYTLLVHTDHGVDWYTLHVQFVHTALLEVERDTPCHIHSPHCVRLKGMHPHVHIVGGKKGYTLKSTLFTMGYTLPSTLFVERYTTSRPHYWWWKGIQPQIPGT